MVARLHVFPGKLGPLDTVLMPRAIGQGRGWDRQKSVQSSLLPGCAARREFWAAVHHQHAPGSVRWEHNVCAKRYGVCAMRVVKVAGMRTRRMQLHEALSRTRVTSMPAETKRAESWAELDMQQCSQVWSGQSERTASKHERPSRRRVAKLQ